MNIIKIESIGIALTNIKRRGPTHPINPDSINYLNNPSYVRHYLKQMLTRAIPF